MATMNKLALFLVTSLASSCAIDDTIEEERDLVGLAACAPVPRCDASPPAPGPRRSFARFDSWLNASFNSANHRGRDQFLVAGQPQWIIGRFAYGLGDTPLVGEEVDVYLSRGCGASWEKLATLRTTAAGAHATVEGVADDGGRIYFQLPAGKTLAAGRHRVRLVVGGDLTATELYLEVVAPGTALFVSDVDGTLTTHELEELFASLSNTLPNANPDAARQLAALVAKGYRPFYLTARPERLAGRTRDFLAARGLPPGIVHTSLGGSGQIGAGAIAFKSGELEALDGKGLPLVVGLGNTDTDAQAYRDVGLPRRLFFRYADGVNGGQRFDDYAELATLLAGLPAVCQ
jgi:phosphatidate phosphatase PAH1